MYEKQCQSHLYPSQRNHPPPIGVECGVGEVVIKNHQIIVGKWI